MCFWEERNLQKVRLLLHLSALGPEIMVSMSAHSCQERLFYKLFFSPAAHCPLYHCDGSHIHTSLRHDCSPDDCSDCLYPTLPCASLQSHAILLMSVSGLEVADWRDSHTLAIGIYALQLSECFFLSGSGYVWIVGWSGWVTWLTDCFLYLPPWFSGELEILLCFPAHSLYFPIL